MVVISGLVAIYYNMIIAYTLYYTFVSFTTKLPWQDCRPEWEQYNCQERGAMNATMRNMTSKSRLLWLYSINELGSSESFVCVAHAQILLTRVA